MTQPSLEEVGRQKIEWAETWMRILAEIRRRWEKERPLKGIRVAACLHVEAKTAALVRTLATGGAQVALAPCNPESTQDDVARALAASGVKVYARRGMSMEEYWEAIHKILDTNPHIIIDDGGDAHYLAHSQRQEILNGVLGGTEETTTGVRRLYAMQREGVLRYPVVLVNEAHMKYLFDNRYGTAESTIFGILNATNLTLAGKTVVVVGYGWCGRGIALRAKGMGARVIVCEVDPIRAVEACMDGFEVKPLIEAVKEADFVITATGCIKVVREEHFRVAKDGCIFANAGHFDVEVWIPDLEKLAVKRRKLRWFGLPWNSYLVEEFVLRDGRKLYLLAKGRLVNLVAGQGHATDIMDLSFSLQALSVEWIVRHQIPERKLEPRLYKVPREIDELVARLWLKTHGVRIDELTEEQKRYLASWRLEV